MDKRLASHLIRLNRKVAWLLVISTVALILTGYGQSMQLFDRFLLRDLHLISEWAFISLLMYHVIVGTFIARYPYGSTLKRIWTERAAYSVILRFVLRISSWPLLILAAIVVLSGLSWYGILTISFNRHLQIDALFFIVFIVHAAVGGGVALKRNWPGSSRTSGWRA